MTDADLALYFTYWPGMRIKHSSVCGNGSQADHIVYPGEEKEQISLTDNGVLENRNATSYEACHWIIKPQPYQWKTDSKIYLWIDSVERADFYVFVGTDRQNATLVEPTSGP
jgi:hypothetical protein